MGFSSTAFALFIISSIRAASNETANHPRSLTLESDYIKTYFTGLGHIATINQFKNSFKTPETFVESLKYLARKRFECSYIYIRKHLVVFHGILFSHKLDPTDKIDFLMGLIDVMEECRIVIRSLLETDEFVNDAIDAYDKFIKLLKQSI